MIKSPTFLHGGPIVIIIVYRNRISVSLDLYACVILCSCCFVGKRREF